MRVGSLLLSGTTNCGIFGISSAEFHRVAWPANVHSSGPPVNPRIDLVNGWRGSCPQVNDHFVFRAIVLSFVLILLAGPSAGVLCKAWCNPAEAAARGCHQHPSPSATLTG